MEEGATGTVTPLASMFPVDEAQKAAKRVQDAIAEKDREHDRIRGFIADNTGLVNLVQKLPEELHHDVMVPFGKAAFFPGRLIHTNEFMVLLGEGYYAERTSKQTVEILRRRGKALETHVESLKSVIEDLKTEALFFDRTASEAAEGLVEIREELSGEESDEGASESGQKEDVANISAKDKGEVLNEDEEYVRLMSKLDELEKEELAAEAADNIEEEINEVDPDAVSDQSAFDKKLKDLEGSHPCIPPSHPQEGQTSNEEFLSLKQQQPALVEKLHPSDLAIMSSHKDKTSDGKEPSQNLEGPGVADESLKLPALEGNHHAQSSNNEVSIQPPRPKVDSTRAFTGSIIERSPNLPISPGEPSTSSQVPGSQSSKPLSRFRMQRK